MAAGPDFSIIQQELEAFERKFRASVKSRVPLLDKITYYIINRKGKQLRPKFVLLSARMFGEIKESSYHAAALVELLHTATLVHDDVVDESMERRGAFSINALWKNKVAVLVGDYLLSKGLLLALDNEEHRLLQILSNAVRQMSEGELLQMEKSRKLDIDEATYFEIIRSKTASLLSSACAAGAWSSSRNNGITETMAKFGEAVGMAFQIKDDLFDYGSNNVGKPTGNDIREQKITLPLIYTLQQSDPGQKRKIKTVLKNKNKDKKQIAWIVDLVQASGGIAYASEKMMAFKQEALSLLDQFEDSEPKNVMTSLVNYATDRNY